MAFARIQGLGMINLPETQPGMYSTKITISPDDNVIDAPLIGVLQDNFGGKREWISPIGLI
ncbi:hypothetical protein GMMP15_80036 [Candidatus Magnetomoraceae bacterium gMMP-15]